MRVLSFVQEAQARVVSSGVMAPGAVNSTVKQIVKIMGLRYESDIHPMAFSESTFNVIQSNLENYNCSEKEIADQWKYFSNLRSIYIDLLLNGHEGAISFGTVLNIFLDKNSLSCNSLAKEIGMPVVTLNRWRLDQMLPAKKNIVYIDLIEKRFHLPEGFLRNKAGYVLFGEATELWEDANVTEKGLLIRSLTEQEYSLAYDKWPDLVKSELEDVDVFHTQSYPSGKFKGFERYRTSYWNDGELEGGTERKFRRLLECYFGFLVQNKDIAIGDLTIGHLANLELVDEYVIFKEKRLGYLGKGIKSDLKSIASLTHPVHGLFTQSKEIGENYLNSKSNVKKSDTWLEEVSNCYKDVMTKIRSSQFESIDDEDERIEFITHDPFPYKVVASILKKIKFDAYLEGLSPNRKAQRSRDYLIVLLHFILGHRSHIYSELKIGEHLVKEVDGLWRVTIYRNQLKDKRIIKETKITYFLPIDVSEVISDYVDNHRPLLHGVEGESFFIPSKNSNKERRNLLLPSGISKIFRKMMILYSESETGFPSKAARKIISTALNNMDKNEDFIIGALAVVNTSKINGTHYTKNVLTAGFNCQLEALRHAGIIEKQMDKNEINSILNFDLPLLEKIKILEKKLEEVEIEKDILKQFAYA